jgi:hypothetical protein
MKAQCDANEGPAKEGVTSASFAFTDGFSMFVTFADGSGHNQSRKLTVCDTPECYTNASWDFPSFETLSEKFCNASASFS